MTLRWRWLAQSAAAVPRSTRWLAPAEAERSASLRFPQRRSDFLLGRWTAKCAVARCLGRPLDLRALAAVEIRNAPDGAPEAFVDRTPAPLAISMSDRAGWGVCAAGPPDLAIGCDLELVEPRTEAFVADYLTRAEHARVAKAGRSGRDVLANLIWSAKESALKVLRTGLRRDTRSVEVALETRDPVDGWLRLCVTSSEGLRFPGWWRRYGDFLLTFAAERELPPPEPLIRPMELEMDPRPAAPAR